MATTICPSRLLAEDDGAALETVEWWMMETAFDGMSGAPGLTRWPRRGGMQRQPNRLVEAVRILRAEWNAILSWKAEQRKGKEPEVKRGGPRRT